MLFWAAALPARSCDSLCSVTVTILWPLPHPQRTVRSSAGSSGILSSSPLHDATSGTVESLPLPGTVPLLTVFRTHMHANHLLLLQVGISSGYCLLELEEEHWATVLRGRRGRVAQDRSGRVIQSCALLAASIRLLEEEARPWREMSGGGGVEQWSRAAESWPRWRSGRQSTAAPAGLCLPPVANCRPFLPGVQGFASWAW